MKKKKSLRPWANLKAFDMHVKRLDSSLPPPTVTDALYICKEKENGNFRRVSPNNRPTKRLVFSLKAFPLPNFKGLLQTIALLELLREGLHQFCVMGYVKQANVNTEVTSKFFNNMKKQISELKL